MLTFVIAFVLPVLVSLSILFGAVKYNDARVSRNAARNAARLHAWEWNNPFRDTSDYYRNGASQNERS